MIVCCRYLHAYCIYIGYDVQLFSIHVTCIIALNLLQGCKCCFGTLTISGMLIIHDKLASWYWCSVYSKIPLWRQVYY